MARPLLFWATLIFVSGVPRILGAFLLPNAFGDAYSYLQYIETMRAKMVDGTFAITDLHGFWLPLYQFICAAVGAVFGHSFYVSKLVSAVCGTGVCLLVFQISLRLTGRRGLSLLAFTSIALSPLHILYSASALTDVPNALPVMASLYFALVKRWNLAAVCAAAAALMRIESWMLIALLPALQFMVQRRISLAAIGIMILSPLFWFYVCWKATGDPMAYFEARNCYIVEYAMADPTVATFSLFRLRLDAERLLTSTNLAVLCGCLAAARMVVGRIIREKNGSALLDLFPVAAAIVFFFSNLGFLLLAYFKGDQPQIWTRYGLLFFALGLPALAWALQAKGTPRRRSLLALGILSVFILQTANQVKEVAGCISEETARNNIASHLKNLHLENPNLRIVCDDGGVRLLSGLSSERFVNPLNLPADSAQLLKSLKENGVEYVVCTNWEISTMTKVFPELSRGRENGFFRPVTEASSNRSRVKFWVYRVR